MRYLLFLVLFSVSISYTQIELVLETDFNHNLNSHLFSTQSNLRGDFFITDERVFLRREGITVINEDNQALEPVLDASFGHIVSHVITVNDGVYCAVNEGSTSGTFRLIKINNDLEVNEYYSHDYDMWINAASSGFFFTLVGENIIFFIEDISRKRLFKFNIQTKETVELTNYFRNQEIVFHGADSRGVLYSVFPSSGRQLNYIDEQGDIHTLISGNGDIENISRLNSNDTINFYISCRYNTNTDSVFRVNYEALNRSYFSTFQARSLYFKQNRVLGIYFHSNSFLGNIENDTLAIIHAPIPISKDFPTNVSYYTPKLLDAEKELFTYATNELGLELFTISEEDSLYIVKDLNQGIGHGIPFSHCDQINRLPNGILKHEGEAYYNMTNGNDKHVYLYKVLSDSLEPVLRLVDFNPGRIRYFTFDEHLYYFVYNSESNKIRLYKVRWSDMNDTQNSELSFDTNSWATETSFKRVNQVCQSSGWTNISPLDINTDKNGNTYINSAAVDNSYKSWLFDRRNKQQMVTTLCNAYQKYDKYGQLKWMKTIGGPYKSGFTMYDKFALDDNKNLQVYGVFFKKAYFDGDSLETVGSARFYAKINGETGEVIAHRTLYETDYTDDTRFDALIKGEDNYFYLAGSYRNFKQDFGDTILISNWNYQNFLAKYDDNGNLIWIRNILNNWNNVIGEINNIEYSKDNNEIMVFCSQNRTWCNDGTWRGELIFYDTDGKEKIRKGIQGYDRHTLGKATALDSRYYLVKGSIKEAIQAGVYETSDLSSENCQDTYDYQLIYDRQQNTFVTSTISDSINGMNIKRVFKDEDYFYFCGNRVKGRDIVIQRFDKKGSYRGEKVLNQIEDLRVVDFGYDDGYFVLIMRDAVKDTFLKVNPIFGDVRNVMNVIRFEINDWDYLQSFKQMDVQLLEEEGMLLYAFPNPTYGKVQINYSSENIKFEKYRVLNAAGQRLFEDEVPNQNFVTVDLSNYQNGLYFIQFEGHGIREVVKVIKQP